uniref:Uncharacterized protein n=1 Tax=Aegilops tauschii TaxID=37682 RepID=N1QVU8_AEGTA
MGTLCELCRCDCCSVVVAAADFLGLFSAASSVSICCCRHSSLQNGVSPLRQQRITHAARYGWPSSPASSRDPRRGLGDGELRLRGEECTTGRNPLWTISEVSKELGK